MPPEKNFRIDVQYQGAAFQGWQWQPNGLTVEEAIVTAYERFLQVPVRIAGSGRTDAGVHGRHQIASLRLEKDLPARAILLGVKPYLHPQVAIFHAEQMPLDWRPRPVLLREYRYFLWKSPTPPLFLRPYCAGTLYPLEAERMRRAADLLAGEHDFSSFRAAGCTSKTTVRRLERIEILDRGDYWCFRILGNAFLRQMVRILVGTLVEVGRAGWTPEDISRILAARNRDAAGPTLPPQGLFFWEITLENETRPARIPPTVWDLAEDR
jgi:tRNA pseudouridine38-40 synthase